MIKVSLKRYFSLKLVKFAFRDAVSGESVYVYEDCYGDRWMKTSRWSLFAVKAS